MIGAIVRQFIFPYLYDLFVFDNIYIGVSFWLDINIIKALQISVAFL